jgi:ubiquinone/menaquinone biosynthesis C-methylase UbiE
MTTQSQQQTEITVAGQKGYKVACPVCSGSKVKLVTQRLRFNKKADIYQCAACELVFLDPQSFQFPKDFYEKEYHQTYLTHIEPDALNPDVYFEKMLKTNQTWSKMFREMLTGQEVVLDVGCSTGHFIHLVQDKTKKMYGHELSEKEVEFCRNIKKLDVSNEPLEKRFKEGTFDYITMIFVLEHIEKPKEFLAYLKKFLKPTGKFLILVPNIDDALMSHYDIPEFRDFYYCIEHFFYFNTKTIQRLFDEVGLTGDVRSLQEYPITNHLNWAYRKTFSDVLAARKGIPSAPVTSKVSLDSWEQLWREFNQKYLKYLQDSGFGDRVWCVVGPKSL